MKVKAALLGKRPKGEKVEVIVKASTAKTP